jgi:L-lysine 2,3-aminomutase
VATGSCAVHCRYCFRRHFPYAEETAAANRWQAAIDYLRADPSINELLLSGGDPLSLSTAKLAELTGSLHDLPACIGCASTPVSRSCCPNAWTRLSWTGCEDCPGRWPS